MKRIGIFTFIILIFVSVNSYAQETGSSTSEPSGKFWGFAFGDYFYKVTGDSIPTGLEYSKYKKDFNSFEFRRINIGYDYSFNENFAATISVSYDGEELTPDGKRTVYVRDADIKWKSIFTNSDLSFGILPTPGFTVSSEKVWGYRSVEKTIMDQRGILGSRDLGIMLNGAFDKNKSFNYYFMIGNGRGTRLENNKYKRFYGNLFYNSPDKKFFFNVYGDYERSDYIESSKLNKTTAQTFFGVQLERFTFGAELFRQYQSVTFTRDTITYVSVLPDPWGLSLFTTGTLVLNKLKYFARYDYWNTDKGGINQHFVSLGLDFTPINKIHFMPNLWLNAYDGGRKSDVVPRITVYFDSR